MQLRNHPSMSRHGIRNWPPHWTTIRIDPNDQPVGEVGILVDALMNTLFNDKCFLLIDHEGQRYMGCMTFDNPAFCATIHGLLNSNIGKSIKEIAELDVTHTL